MQRIDGQNYAPVGKSNRVCKEGEFVFAAVGLDHGHIYGMCNGLVEAGAELKYVFDSDKCKIEAFKKTFPQVKEVSSYEEILKDESVSLIAIASIPSERAEIAIKALNNGKHVFSDKPGMTTEKQLEKIKEAVKLNNKRYAIYFSERLHVEAATYADYLIEKGEIGKVVQTIVLGPHRLNESTRPEWFFDEDKFGGIITDIGSHQIEQILHYTGATDAKIAISSVLNINNQKHEKFQDFGDAYLILDNGTRGYFRVDWFTPKGLRAWGDGRTIILGTEGYIELRKYINIAKEDKGNMVYYANSKGEFEVDANNTLGFPFFGEFIRDLLSGTEKAIGQDYTFKVMELALQAQKLGVEGKE